MIENIIKKIICCSLFVVLPVCTINVSAQKLSEIKSLGGYWSFSVGDEDNWKLPDYDVSGWDKIYVGRNWESQGYDGYNGYAWYIKKVDLKGINDKKLILKINQIDDADEVYFNGTLIGKMGGFPPLVKTAYNQTRRYAIPRKLIYKDFDNTIAIRVYDFYNEGGVIGHIGIYRDIFESYYLVDLTGIWKFKIGSDDKWRETSYNDTHWTNINVPGYWENQGFANYDGAACYRKTFHIKNNDFTNDLVLVAGRIDDQDEIYINGKLIGSIYQLKNDKRYYNGKDFKALRVYSLSKDVLQKGNNTIFIKVYDTGGAGGIYKGPVGIMTVPAFENYFTKYEDSKSLLDYILEDLFY